MNMLNEMPGNTESTLANRGKSCITCCSFDRNYLVTTASADASSGSPEPQVEFCCVTAARAYD